MRVYESLEIATIFDKDPQLADDDFIEDMLSQTPMESHPVCTNDKVYFSQKTAETMGETNYWPLDLILECTRRDLEEVMHIITIKYID